MNRRRQTSWKSGTGAFTLVELLVVVAILGILIAMVISISNAVRQTGGDEKLRGDMALLMTQIRAYHDATTKYPGQWPGYDPNVWNAADDTNRDTIAKHNCGVLVKRLEAVQATQSELHDRFDADRFAKANGDLDGPGGSGDVDFYYFTDGLGGDKPLNYLSTGGPGGTPVLVSAGPDRQWGTPDDCRSDDRR